MYAALAVPDPSDPEAQLPTCDGLDATAPGLAMTTWADDAAVGLNSGATPPTTADDFLAYEGDGVFTSGPLIAGHYCLVEQVAPSGYELLPAPQLIEITPGLTGEPTVEVVNYPHNAGFELPATGEPGRLNPWLIVGAVLLAAAAGNLVYYHLRDRADGTGPGEADGGAGGTGGGAGGGPRGGSTGGSDDGAPRGKHSAATLRARIAGLMVVTLVTAAGLVAVLGPPPAAAEPSVTFYVNSLDLDAAASGSSLTDGVCTTGTQIQVTPGGFATEPECTLRAALQESNAMNRPAGEILITVSPNLTCAGECTIQVPTSATADRMFTGNVTAAVGGSPTGVDYGSSGNGALFHVSAPVVIDMANRVEINNAVDSGGPGAIFYITGKDITFQNMVNVFGHETSFYVAPGAANITLTNLSIATDNYAPERLILVRGGASNIVFKDSDVRGFYGTDPDGSWVLVDRSSSAFPVDSLTIDNVYFTSLGTGVCSA